MQEIRDFLSLLAMGLLVISLPIVIAAAVQHYRVMTQQLRTGKNAAQWDLIFRAVGMAVTVAQQTGIIGPEQRQRAIKFAQDFLDARGVKIDVDQLATLIETELRRQVTAPVGSLDTPASRQQLFQSVIESAVLAAEQSGLTGAIQNTAVAKKQYAVQVAREYLHAQGLQGSDDLIGGLIEAQLMRLYMSSHGQMPTR
jgi:hypothetical protein